MARLAMAARQLAVRETAAAAGRAVGESRPWEMCGARVVPSAFA